MIRDVIVCVVITLAVAVPIEKDDDARAKVVNFENENDGKGNYRFTFETSNGILREESGFVVNEGKPDEHISVVGSVSYTDPDGKKHTFRYAADENGYEILPEVEKVVFSLPANVVASLLG